MQINLDVLCLKIIWHCVYPLKFGPTSTYVYLELGNISSSGAEHQKGSELQCTELSVRVLLATEKALLLFKFGFGSSAI